MADSNIARYSVVNTSFYLRKDLAPAVMNFGSDKTFAVTVNTETFYVGEFRPAYLRSLVFGIASIIPTFIGDRQIKIDFIQIGNSPELKALDR